MYPPNKGLIKVKCTTTLEFFLTVVGSTVVRILTFPLSSVLREITYCYHVKPIAIMGLHVFLMRSPS